jgi:methylglyoxal synthase
MRIALVAHDNKKWDLVDWARFNSEALSHHRLLATSATAAALEEGLKGELHVPIDRFHSGPLGGDLQLGAKISEGQIDLLLFFWDPLEPQPHDPDVKALLRIAVVWNIPVACNRATADFLVTSPLFDGDYHRVVPEYSGTSILTESPAWQPSPQPDNRVPSLTTESPA